MVHIWVRIRGRFRGKRSNNVLRSATFGGRLLEVSERLDVEQRRDIGQEVDLEPHRLIHAERLKRRLVE